MAEGTKGIWEKHAMSASIRPLVLNSEMAHIIAKSDG